MRQTILKVLLVAVMVVAGFSVHAIVARADGGGPFTPGDSRIDPTTNDRVAVYIHDDHVDVWGLNSDNVGFALTTFSLDELKSGKTIIHKTADGTIKLMLVSPAVWHTGYSDYTATSYRTIVDTSAVYAVSWSGGSFGADGSAPFTKTFYATYFLPKQSASQQSVNPSSGQQSSSQETASQQSTGQ